MPGAALIDALIERLAREALDEIERMADAALVAVGFPKETVNRRRGQLRRYRKDRPS